MLKSPQLNTFIATLTVAAATTLTVQSAQAASLLYVTSDRTDSVLQYDGLTGKFLGVLDDGPHDNYGGAIGLALDPDGNLYLSRGYANTVQRYNSTTQRFEDFTKGGSLALPHQFAFGGLDKDLYLANLDGTVQRFDGKTGDFESIIPKRLGTSAGLAIEPSGNLYISSRDDNKVYNYDAATQTLSVFAEVVNPDALLLGTDGFLYISQINRQIPGHSNDGNVLRYKTDGTPFGAGCDPKDPAAFICGEGERSPAHMAFGPDGNFYVADYNTNKVLRYNSFTGAPIDGEGKSFIESTDLQGTYGLVFKTVPNPNPQSIPEPSSGLGVLALGAIGAGAILKRLQQHKILDNTDS
jgi:sugar lactone lactonase YvrE